MILETGLDLTSIVFYGDAKTDQLRKVGVKSFFLLFLVKRYHERLSCSKVAVDKSPVQVCVLIVWAISVRRARERQSLKRLSRRA